MISVSGRLKAGGIKCSRRTSTGDQMWRHNAILKLAKPMVLAWKPKRSRSPKTSKSQCKDEPQGRKYGRLSGREAGADENYPQDEMRRQRQDAGAAPRPLFNWKMGTPV